VRQGLHGRVKSLRRIVLLKTVRQILDRTFDRAQTLVEFRARQQRFHPRDGILQVADIFVLLGGAALAFGLVATRWSSLASSRSSA
jgi:hypothetical protein